MKQEGEDLGEVEEEDLGDNLYFWTFESNDLAQLVIGLRSASNVAYSVTKGNFHLINYKFSSFLLFFFQNLFSCPF